MESALRLAINPVIRRRGRINARQRFNTRLAGNTIPRSLERIRDNKTRNASKGASKSVVFDQLTRDVKRVLNNSTSLVLAPFND